ncbi:MAG: aldolase/citrate lyase family protein [Planctomyces sp.]
MNIRALQQFRRKLAAGEPVYGIWVTMESPAVTEAAVALGIDWIVVDAEHGHLDWKEVSEHIRSAVRSSTVVLVRIAERNTALTKRALDIGADGIVVPWIESLAQFQEAVSDCQYPPEGRRGIGGERATVWGQCLTEHTSEANHHVLVVPIIESVAAVAAVPNICMHDRAEVLFFGPADFSATAGYRGQWEGPGVADQILILKDTIRKAGLHCGLLTTSQNDLLQRRDQGFRMLGLGADVGIFLRSLRQSLATVSRDRAPATSLAPEDGRRIIHPLPVPPASMKPDRAEVVTTREHARTSTIQAGVTFEMMVGEFLGARNLTTGIVTFDPLAKLDCHTHPCSESITVLDGTVEITVEGRQYRLGPLDNILIPRWVPHAGRNPDPEKPARIHIAMPTSTLSRELVTRQFDVTTMSDDSTGTPGFERVTRFRTAHRSFGVGPGAEFIDFFNSDLVPGLEMSGGFGRFQPGGRLPAHVHDFDESICIIDGSATCIVEGRRYTMGDCATAMAPRGRVHYFVNESDQSLDMIWVYAGPMPERIVVDEKCVTVEGNPWKH